MSQEEYWDRLLFAIESDDSALFASLFERVPSERIAEAAADAASMGAVRVLAWWLAHGLDPCQRYFNTTTLYRTAVTGQTGAMRLLLEAGAKLDGVPLVAAASSGSLECVRLLVEAGADVNHGNPGFPTPLGAAEDKGHAEIARYLLERGATRRVGA